MTAINVARIQTNESEVVDNLHNSVAHIVEVTRAKRYAVPLEVSGDALTRAVRNMPLDVACPTSSSGVKNATQRSSGSTSGEPFSTSPEVVERRVRVAPLADETGRAVEESAAQTTNGRLPG